MLLKGIANTRNLISVREMVVAMQDADAGIPLDTHMCHKENKAHKLCFTGEEMFQVLSFTSLKFTSFDSAQKFKWDWWRFRSSYFNFLYSSLLYPFPFLFQVLIKIIN